MKTYIKLYGERNTGTNYFSKILQLNLDTIQLPGIAPPTIITLQQKLPGKELVRDLYFKFSARQNLGWKHSSLTPHIQKLSHYADKHKLVIITLTKNPYSWLLSLYRNPYHQNYKHKPDFIEFLQTPWKTVQRDNLNRKLKNPIELWNLKNSSYLSSDRHNSLNITSEQLLTNPARIMENISTRFNIKRLSEEFIDYQQSTKDQKKNSDYYRDYYLQEKWRENLNKESTKLINQSLDHELMMHFGYDLLISSCE